MTLNVWTIEETPDNVYCPRRSVVAPRDVTAIKAYRLTGSGTATIYYAAQLADGTWTDFRKQDNKGVKLPMIKEFPHRVLTDVRGIRGVYRLESEPINV